MFVCRSENCDREFDTKAGRGSHEGHSHEGVASKIIDCKQCGGSFKVERNELENGREYCSQECSGLDKRESDSWFYCRSCGDELKEEGSDVCNYCDDCQIFDCRVSGCGKSFPSKSSRNSHEGQIHPEFNGNESVCVGGCGEVLETGAKYCDECRSDRRSELVSGKENPMYSDGFAVKKEKVCEQCGGCFETHTNKSFCSYSCYGEWQSENRVGSNHPNYKGGERYVYGSGWAFIREEVIIRDKEKCIECGISREDHKEKYGKDLSVDHIIPRREFIDGEGNIDDDKANDLENLRTLCFSCHTKLEFNK